MVSLDEKRVCFFFVIPSNVAARGTLESAPRARYNEARPCAQRIQGMPAWGAVSGKKFFGTSREPQKEASGVSHSSSSLGRGVKRARAPRSSHKTAVHNAYTYGATPKIRLRVQPRGHSSSFFVSATLWGIRRLCPREGCAFRLR